MKWLEKKLLWFAIKRRRGILAHAAYRAHEELHHFRRYLVRKLAAWKWQYDLRFKYKNLYWLWNKSPEFKKFLAEKKITSSVK